MFRNRYLIVFLAVAGIVFASIGWLGYGIYQTRVAISAGQALELSTAVTHASLALPVARSLNSVTFSRLPEARLWQTSLEVIQDTPTIVAQLTSTLAKPNRAPTETSKSETSEYVAKIAQLNQHLEKSVLLSRIFPEKIQYLKSSLADVQTVSQSFFTGRHSYLIVFQNTHELRATGGFIGSYAVVTLNQGQLESLSIQDIYVPDGQFKGFVPAPPGVQEYLSSGQGLRLPDANWWPDFPASAQQILAYFALGKESHLEGVIAVNLEMAETLLAITGDVFVPDYQMTVTSENLADMLRHQRQDFFPGSISKQHLLESTFNQVKFKLADMTPSQQRQLATVLKNAILKKDLQLYANDEELQHIIEKYQAGGLMTASADSDLYIFPVESNVGINKANAGVNRQAKLVLGETSTELTLEFRNDNQATSAGTLTSPDESPHYANYQRLLIKPDMTVRSVSLNGQALAAWNQEIITTSTGEQYKQLGFLVPAPAQTSTTVTFMIDHPQLPSQPTIYLPKQSGVPPMLYQVTHRTKTQEVWLYQDTLVRF